MSRILRLLTAVSVLPALLPCPAALAQEGPQAEAPAADHPLAGSEWRLVEIQSMDDAIGTARPHDPSFYTLRLDRDGTLAMRLNCNRASGRWFSEPAADRTSGSFQFGPLAMTRALCPPPSLDERLAAQTSFVRSYLLKDGRLHLSLMADGGILVWERLGPWPGQATLDAKLPSTYCESLGIGGVHSPLTIWGRGE